MKRNIYLIPVTVVITTALLSGAFVAGGITGKLRIAPLYRPIEHAESLLRDALAKARGQATNQTFVESSLMELSLTTLAVMPENLGNNIAFSSVGDGHLIANRDGELYYTEFSWPDHFSLQRLPYQVPVEKERFLQQSITERPPRIPVQFGLKDIFTLQDGDGLHIYASHHFCKEPEQCAVFRLSALRITGEQLIQAKDSEWQTLFESQPCLKLDERFNRLGEDDTFL